MKALTIGQAAELAGVNTETLRYYERQGIVPPPSRSQANYRLYSDDTVRRVRFVKRAQELGFSLAEITELLLLRARRGSSCDAVRQRAIAKIASIDGKIATLQAMRGALEKLVSDCASSRGPLSECPILEALDANEKGGSEQK